MQARAGELLSRTLRAAPGHPDPDVSELLRSAADPYGGGSGCGPGARTRRAGAGAGPLHDLATALASGSRPSPHFPTRGPSYSPGDLAPLSGGLSPLRQARLHAAWQPHPEPHVPLRPGRYGRESALLGGATSLADRVFTALSPPSGTRP